MKRTLSAILPGILTVLIVAGTGCHRSVPKPPGLSDLVPCKVKVIQDGAPLEGADVTLVPVTPTGTVWPVGGHTNAAGIAEMRTYGTHPGVPADKYKVVVSKVEIEVAQEAPVPTANSASYQAPKETHYHLVTPALGFAPTTTLEIQVEKGTVNYSVDVGAAVRILKQQPQ